MSRLNHRSLKDPDAGYNPQAGFDFEPGYDTGRVSTKPHRQTSPSTGASIASKLVWLICIAWTVLSVAITVSMMSKANSAVQEATAAAMLCASIMAAYVVARACDRITS